MGFIRKLRQKIEDLHLEQESKLDAIQFLEKYPELNNNGPLIMKAFDELRDVYSYYKQTVSPGNSAISLQVAAFLIAAVQNKNAKRILDLGSGFSSFVFRRNPRCEVTSVDSNKKWLERTRSFLRKQRVDDTRLLTWDEFEVIADIGYFDIVFVDIRPISRRVEQFERLLSLCSPGGVLIYDDYHKEHLRKPLKKKLNKSPVIYFNLMDLTLDEVGRYDAWIERTGSSDL